MANGDEIKVNVSTIGSKTAAVAGGVVEVVVVGNVADVLEMEDVLFHHNSNVLMPECPEGKSSKKDKGKSQEAQKALTGVKALAMVFKHAEHYPNKRLLVTGHADTSGGISDNFDLSKQRAKSVLYLLKGDDDSRSKWCENCYARHKVEDYQQILNYFRGHKPNWDYRLLNIDNKCGSRTREAIDGFVVAYNRDYATPKNWEPLPANLSAIIKASSGDSTKRKWPQDQWQAIFRLYTQLLCDVLGAPSADKLPYANLKYLEKDGDATEMVGCGHSFPVDALGRKNYRSQADRRVEILFFGKNETPDMSTCPPGTDALHKKGECPIWNKFSLKRNYIDSRDLYAIVYHLKFEYYNPITKKFMCLPNTGLDLKIKAYQKKTAEEHDKATEIPTVTEYDSDTYSVKVRFTEQTPDFTNKHLYFGFETTDQWIYTKDKDSTPEIKTVTKVDFDKLSLVEQFKHYRLPAMWYSFNYWTRYDSSDDKKGDLFQKAVKDERKLKPFGDKITALDKPLTFSLDDIVLVDESDTDKEDIDQDIKDKNQSGANKKLCEGGVESRVKIFIVDDDPANANATKQLKLYRTTANDPKTARIKFSRNVITEKAAGTKIVAFRDGFYTVTGKRVNKVPVNWASKGFVAGARTAHRDAKNKHLHWEMKGRAGRAAEFLYTGDYDLHYFHHLHMDGASPVSFLIIYISMAFMRDTRPYPAVSPPTRPGSAEVKKFVDEGVYNSMRHWNLKGYWLEENQTGMDPHPPPEIIRVFRFFDERETFQIADADVPVGANYDFDDQDANNNPHKLPNVFAHGKFTAAQAKAYGGPVKFVCFICPDKSNTHPYGEAYHWNTRTWGHKYSIMKLNKSAFDNVPGIFDYNDKANKVNLYKEDGNRYGVFTLAHEIGHATSLPDEYIKRDTFQWVVGATKHVVGSYPHFTQFFEQYTMPKNSTSMMYENGAPRLHHTWYHQHWLNSRIKEPTDDLSKEAFLKGREFKIRFKTPAKDHTFIREIGHTFTPTSKIRKDIRKPIIDEEQYELTAGPTRRRLYLALYDVGQDEASTGWFHGNQNNVEYQGVLVVRVMLGISVDGTVADWYNPRLRSSVLGTALNGLRAAWVKLGETYRLTTNADKKIKNIYVHFLPGILMQGSTANKENYKLKYLKPPTVQLANHPDGSKVTAVELAKLNKKLIYDNPNKKLSYKQKMTIGERFQLHKMFSVEADRQKVTQLHTLTQTLPAGIVNNNGSIDVAINITPEDLKLHFLNMNEGDNEKDKLAFLKTWVDAKLGYAFTLEKITP